MTNDYAAGLREYADYVEAHPELNIDKAQISIYSVNDPGEILSLLHSHPSAKLRDWGDDQITLLVLQFGPLHVRFCLNKETVYEPAIVNGKVTWALRPEFDMSTHSAVESGVGNEL